jgi:long-chain acyl-CoA synthetase
MTLQAPFSVPVIEPMSSNEGPVHRSVAQPYSLVERPSNEVRTLFELMQYAEKKHANMQTFGMRPVIAKIEEEKEIERNGKKEMKKWTYMHLGPFEWQTYKQVSERSRSIGAGLRARCQLQAGDRLLIFNSTR